MESKNIKVSFYNVSGTSNAVKPEEEISDNSSGKIGNAVQTQSSISRSAIASSLINSSKQIMSEGFSTFTDLTGNYVQKASVDGLINAGATAMLLMNYPVGTIAGITKIGIDAVKGVIEQRKADKVHSILLARAGKETINNSEGNW